MSNFLIPILCIALFLLLKDKPATANFTRCKDTERQALLDFTQNLVFGFDVERDCCTWLGVECSNRTGQVIKLDLKSSFIITPGTISPSLLKLHHLSYLDLSFNDFKGSLIPKFIGSFRKLRYLDLSNTNLSGPIPSELENLSRLETLSLSQRAFRNLSQIHNVGNLEWLSRLSSIKVLDLSFINLSQASDWSQVVNQLPFLQTLNLSGCSLPNTIPLSFSLINSSTSLSTLNLQANGLTSSAIYPWLFNVSNNLVNLDLSLNQLKGPIPKAFGNMVAMRSLDLSFNQLKGSIPKAFGNMVAMRSLDLSFNQLKGSIPKAFGNMVAMRSLLLSGNELEDKIPISFWNMCYLSRLDLESNHLSGDVSEFVQNMSRCTGNSLKKLRLAMNQLTGSVPKEITKLSSLKELDLGYNRLNGTISERIGQLSNLVTLRLPGNSFENVVISEAHFSNLFNLQELHLSYSSLTLKFNSGWIPPFQLSTIYLASCKLGPSFPKWLSSQIDLNILDLSAAEISDSFPNWLVQYNTLNYLNLSFNQINGNFPSLNTDNSILYLDLSSNNLTGQYPHLEIGEFINLSKNKFNGSIFSICNYENDHLQFLDLSDNLFSGLVPDCFGQLPNLRALNLAGNSFSGPIPSSLGYLSHLETLSLRGNRFSGGISSSLKNCSHLKFLDLSDNRLLGNLPIWIGKSLSSLVFLSLQANQFDGSIPKQLCELNHIQILDLSLNKISGAIPHCFINFTFMAQKVHLNTTIEYIITIVDEISIDGTIKFGFNYVNDALLMWKGERQKYDKILGLLLVIDLSSNELSGEIPKELTRLQELVALNLSRNFLTGKIPDRIGHLRQLQSLDLSRNKFSGSIPSSLSELSFLSTLDLSYNYLSGKIPTGTQLQGFDPLMFSHNHGLCGPPVTPNCSVLVETTQGQPERDQDDFDNFAKWLYVGMGLGFVVGFWGFCGAVLFKRSWRHSYFRFLDNVKDRLYVSFVLLKARLERRTRRKGEVWNCN